MTLWDKWTHNSQPKDFFDRVNNWLFRAWKWLYIGSAVVYTIVFGVLAVYLFWLGVNNLWTSGQ